LPLNVEKEELVVMGRSGSVLDENVVRDALVMGFTTSLRVADDAVAKIKKSLQGYSGR